MQIGDLVTLRTEEKRIIGIILSICRSQDFPPDYRRPDQFSVYWGIDQSVEWFWKNELRVINESYIV